MNLNERDRRAITAGAALAILIIIAMPLLRKWSDMGGDLAVRRAEVARLKQSTGGYEALVRRRDVLVSRLGSLLGPEPKTEDSSGKQDQDRDKPIEDAKNDKAAPSGENPSDASEEARDAPELPKDTEQASTAPDETEAPPPDSADTVHKDHASETEQKPGGPEHAREPGQHHDSEAPVSADDKEPEKAPGESRPEGEDTESAKTEETSGKDGAAPAKATATESVAGYVGRAAKESGIKIKRVTPKKTPGSGQGRAHFRPATVQITMETTTESLVRMLHSIEKGGRFTHVEQLQLTRDASKGNTIEVSLDVMAYEAGEG